MFHRRRRPFDCAPAFAKAMAGRQDKRSRRAGLSRLTARSPTRKAVRARAKNTKAHQPGWASYFLTRPLAVAPAFAKAMAGRQG
jgi:hypothetical protein